MTNDTNSNSNSSSYSGSNSDSSNSNSNHNVFQFRSPVPSQTVDAAAFYRMALRAQSLPECLLNTRIAIQQLFETTSRFHVCRCLLRGCE